MLERRHLGEREPCPLLPAVGEVITAEVTRSAARGRYDDRFYLAALRFAQSLWLEGKAAQALLQLNKALMADLQGDERVLLEWPLPYAAKRWLIENTPSGEFLGNPVRHYQHLASRMSGPRPELRSWRAWACFHLAEAILPGEDYPRDEQQIAQEQLIIPSWDEVVSNLKRWGLPGEASLVRQAVAR